MLKKKAVFLIVGAALFIAAGAGLAGYFLLYRTPQTHTLAELLQKADDFIARSYLAEAEAAVNSAYGVAAEADDYLRILKRSYALSGLKNDYRGLKIRAVTAFEKFPSHPALCRVALYACLRDGDLGRALSLRHWFGTLPEVQALQAEALLKNNTPSSDPALGRLPVYTRFADLDSEKDPERLLAAARELEDERFSLDAALLLMRDGKAAAAGDLARRRLLDSAFDEPAGLIAYELGFYEEAANRLQGAAGEARGAQRPDLSIILGDCRLLLSQPERAAAFYDQALQIDAAYSFVPYVNRAWTARRLGFEEKALYLLREAYRRFPGNETITFEYSKLLFTRGETAEARRLLLAFSTAHPDDFDARFLSLSFESGTLAPDRLLLRLKDLYFENPKNERAAARLIAMLCDASDLPGARAILTHYVDVNGENASAWVANAEGMFQAVAGELNASAGRFAEALARHDRWEYRYNRAAVSLELGKLSDAEQDLRQALAWLASPADRPRARELALVHAALAAVFHRQGNRREAEREVGVALGLDSKNTDAYRLQQKLEAARRK